MENLSVTHDSGSLQSQKRVSGMLPVQQRRKEVTWRPGQGATWGRPNVGIEFFRKQMYCIEESTFDTVEIFDAPRSDSATP